MTNTPSPVSDGAVAAAKYLRCERFWLRFIGVNWDDIEDRLAEIIDRLAVLPAVGEALKECITGAAERMEELKRKNNELRAALEEIVAERERLTGSTVGSYKVKAYDIARAALASED